MDDVQIDASGVGRFRVRRELSVERVPGLEDDLITGLHPQNGSDIRVPSIVAGFRFGLEWFRRIYADLVPLRSCQRTGRNRDGHRFHLLQATSQQTSL